MGRPTARMCQIAVVSLAIAAFGCGFFGAFAKDKASQTVEVLTERAIASHQQGNFEEAIARYSEAIKLDPNNAVLFHNRGLSETSAQKFSAANMDFDKAIDIDPRNAWFYNNRGALHLLRGNLGSARLDFKKAIAIDGSNPAFRASLRKVGDPDEVVPARSPQRPQQAMERPLPDYNVDRHCDEIAGFSGSYSYEVKNYCVEDEQKSYNNLVQTWPLLPYNITDHCTELGSFGKSYSVLEYCTESESAARSDPRRFRSAD